MKVFIAYRFTGEDPQQLEPMLRSIIEAFNDRGVEAYSTFFDDLEFQDKSMSAKEIMVHAFRKIDDSDLLFVVQTSDNKSEGMIMEVGYCIAKHKPIVAAVRNTVGYTYVPDMAHISFRWQDNDGLRRQIRSLDLGAL